MYTYSCFEEWPSVSLYYATAFLGILDRLSLVEKLCLIFFLSELFVMANCSEQTVVYEIKC